MTRFAVLEAEQQSEGAGGLEAEEALAHAALGDTDHEQSGDDRISYNSYWEERGIRWSWLRRVRF